MNDINIVDIDNIKYYIVTNKEMFDLAKIHFLNGFHYNKDLLEDRTKYRGIGLYEFRFNDSDILSLSNRFITNEVAIKFIAEKILLYSNQLKLIRNDLF